MIKKCSYLLLVMLFVFFVSCKNDPIETNYSQDDDTASQDDSATSQDDSATSQDDCTTPDDNSIKAASASYSDVAAAIALADDGDTVSIPCGTGYWTQPMSISKNIHIKGNGENNTTIDFTYNGGNFTAAFEMAGDGYWELSDMTIDVTGSTRSVLIRTGCSTAWRVHDITFNAGSIGIGAYTFGCIDNCTLNDTYGVSIRFIHPDDDEYEEDPPYDGPGSYSWAMPAALGTANAVYVEDCVFNYTENLATHPVGASVGGRYVCRYNTVNYEPATGVGINIDAHGNYGVNRGTFSYEIYENTINNQRSGEVYGFFIRGGQGVIYDNALANSGSGDFSFPIALRDYRAADEEEWDWPYPDQINNLYIWDNTEDGSPITPDVLDDGDNREAVQEGRDYFLEEKSGYSAYAYPHPLRS